MSLFWPSFLEIGALVIQKIIFLILWKSTLRSEILNMLLSLLRIFVIVNNNRFNNDFHVNEILDEHVRKHLI